ncbi:hypothetical protein B7R21_16650 [Subtercola boreus]|uniref:Uncharacterized protein n=1 Tax=Subtercola boreus TaxID=120213 RepID=A0A3E0VBL5_9MICO|nr:hypothetical protein [Subtercola boreus]RFA07089.1 hypothetical protein B7R21_16650 [Subtercola boreus]
MLLFSIEQKVETKMRKSWLTKAAVVDLALATPISMAQSAAAVEDEPITGTASLHFAGYDVQRAAENGFDIRTDSDGLQYAVPTGTPEGSLDGATPKYNPTTGEVVSIPGSAARQPANGDCGTSDLVLYDNTTGHTQYDLNGAFGAAVSHTWSVALTSSIDAGSEPLDGLPPFPGISFSWDTNFTHDVQAIGGTTLEAVAGGTVTTTLGTCYGGNPISAVVWQD